MEITPVLQTHKNTGITLKEEIGARVLGQKVNLFVHGPVLSGSIAEYTR